MRIKASQRAALIPTVGESQPGAPRVLINSNGRSHLQCDEGLLGLVVGEEGADVRLVVLGVAPAPGFWRHKIGYRCAGLTTTASART
jgi:hypothetical protein